MYFFNYIHKNINLRKYMQFSNNYLIKYFFHTSKFHWLFNEKMEKKKEIKLNFVYLPIYFEH